PPLTPVLFGLPLHGWRVRIFRLDPVRRAAGTIRRIAALRDDAFKPKLAGMREHGRAIVLNILVQPQARGRTCDHAGERGLSHLERFAPKILAIELHEVERVEE